MKTNADVIEFLKEYHRVSSDATLEKIIDIPSGTIRDWRKAKNIPKKLLNYCEKNNLIEQALMGDISPEISSNNDILSQVLKRIEQLEANSHPPQKKNNMR